MHKSESETTYQFEGFLLDSSQRQLTRDGSALTLPPKAFDMLVVLIENRERVMSKEELISTIWRDAFVSEDSLSQIIFILRRTLGDDPSTPRFIATSHRRGYRFIADVKVGVPTVAGDVNGHAETATPAMPAALPAPAAPPTEVHATVSPTRTNNVARWTLAAVVLLSSAASWALGHWTLATSAPSAQVRIRSVQNLTASGSVSSGGVLSSDAKWLAFVGQEEQSGKTQLWIRDLATGETQPVRDTDGAEQPFWSPDNQHLGFFAAGNLRIVDLRGSASQFVASVGIHPAGGSWSRTGTIIFASRRSGLSSVAAAGGPVSAVTTLNGDAKESAHRWPHFLPDGRHFLYNVASAEASQDGTYVGVLGGAERTRLLDGQHSVYVDAGYLLFARGSLLMAQPFDAARLRLSGQAVTVATGASPDRPISSAHGVLAFVERTPAHHLAWFNRTGEQVREVAAPASLAMPLITRDGRELVASNGDSRGDHQGIWLSDLDRGVFSRLTTHGGAPVPSPDNARIVFTSDHTNGVRNLYLFNRKAGGGEQALLQTDENKLANDWTRDGRYIVYVSTNARTKRDLWLLPTFGEQRPVPFLATPFNEIQGQVSPDGHWMAYASDETGSWEVYLQSFPTIGSKQIVSTGGGAQPQWRGDGQELFYLSSDRVLMAVDVNDRGTLQIAKPKALFRTTVADLTDGRNRFAVSADGQRFLVDCADTTAGKSQVVLLINWLAGQTP